MPPLSRLLLRSILQLLPFVVLAFPLGYFVGTSYSWMLICFAVFVQLVYQLRNFSKLACWAAHPSTDQTLEGTGAWDDVFGQLYQHEKLLNARIARRDAEIERFEAAGHALIDGVVMLDGQNQIEWCNTTAERQLGLSIHIDRGQPIANLVRRPEFVNYLQAEDFTKTLVLRSGRGVGGERVFAILIIPFAFSRRLMQIQDVTQTDLLDQMRRDFVANVSHELRTPLTVLAGFVETLQELELSAEDQQRYLSMMGEQSTRMQAIVQDLLTLSSLESAPPPENTPVDMAHLLQKLERDAKALSQGKHHIELSVTCDEDICGVENELMSAFGNLVANAIRYTPANGTIRIVWRRLDSAEQQKLEFAVEDTGIGIDPKHIPRLTERFYRVDRGRSRDVGGTGLGLAIVKHTLQRHQAQLNITSQIGQGSRFAAVFAPQRDTK